MKKHLYRRKFIANKEHLDLLKQQVYVWNNWSNTYPDLVIDL